MKLKGKKFGRLTIIGETAPIYIYEGKYSFKKVEVLCSCGKILDVRLDNLKSGHTKSCGCLKKDPSYRIIKALKKNSFDRAFIAVHEKKGLYYCNNQVSFEKAFGLPKSSVSNCISGKRQFVDGWSFKRSV
jgi:hypothetical protein